MLTHNNTSRPDSSPDRSPGHTPDPAIELPLSLDAHTLIGGLSHEGMSYAVSLPPGFKDCDRWPTILFLHGSGEIGNDGFKPAESGLGPTLKANAALYPAVVLMPQLSAESERWDAQSLEKVLAIVKLAERAFRCDGERLGLTGISMGGAGVWELARLAADRFAAFLPICGYGDTRELPRQIAGKPVWICHGAADDVVSVNESRRYFAALTSMGSGSVRFTELPNEGHAVWDRIYADPEIAGWLISSISLVSRMPAITIVDGGPK